MADVRPLTQPELSEIATLVADLHDVIGDNLSFASVDYAEIRLREYTEDPNDETPEVGSLVWIPDTEDESGGFRFYPPRP